MTDELPNGWCETTLGDVADLVSGKTPKIQAAPIGNNVLIPWIKVSDMNLPGNEREINLTWSGFTPAECLENSLPILPVGSIVIPKRGGAIATDKKRKVSKECSIDTNVMGIVPRGINSDYLYYWFMKLDLADIGGGTIVPQINKQDLEPLSIVIAPLNEQKRIADKLDILLARVDACRERLDRVPLLLKRFRQSVMAAAASGKLTEDWREAHSSEIKTMTVAQLLTARHHAWCLSQNNVQCKGKSGKERRYQEPTVFLDKAPDTMLPSGWMPCTIDLVTHTVTDGKHGDCKTEKGSGYYFLSVKDLFDGKLNYEEARQITQDDFMEVHQRTNLELGDVLLTNTGSIGRVAIARDSGKTAKTTFQKSIAVLKPVREALSPDFLAIFLESAVTKVRETASGSAVNNLLLRDIRAFEMNLPPVREQLEIVRRVEALLGQLQSCSKHATFGFTCLQRVYPALLEKAFQGELVPQDPNDEPASDLLARIQKSSDAKPIKPSKRAKRQEILV